MAVEQLLAKLTARGAVLGAVGGGQAEISSADVAAAIAFAGVGRTADRLIRFLYCGDEAQAPLLQAALVHELRRQVPVERALLHRLVRLALLELTTRALCKACDGSGHDGRLATCPTCGGGGLRPFSQRTRAVALDLSLTTFQRHYEAPANQVYSVIAGMAAEALARIAGQLRAA